MSKLPPIPKQQEVQHLIDRSDNCHPGLCFDRFFPCWKKDKNNDAVSADDMRLPLEEICRAFNRLRQAPDYNAMLRDIHDRQKKIARRKKGIELRFKTTAPLALGLGISHASQNGYLFDFTTACPYIPGAALKGACRAWADLCGQKAQTANLFGIDIEPFTRGDLIFLPAYPETWPVLKPDVICNHHFDFYSNEWPKRQYEKGQYPTPMDIESPVPIFHLSLASGTGFSIRILPAGPIETDRKRFDQALETIAPLLAQALAYQGVGAKTAVGYGTLTPLDKSLLEKEWERKPVTSNLTTLVSGLPQDQEAVKAFRARGLALGIDSRTGPDLNELQAGKIEDENRTALTLCISSDTLASESFPEQIQAAERLGSPLIFILLDIDAQRVKDFLLPLLDPKKPEPVYLDPADGQAHRKWFKSLIRLALLSTVEELVISLSHRTSNSLDSQEPAQWCRDKPVLDLRSPLHLEQSPQARAGIRNWTPGSEQAYQEIEAELACIRESFDRVKTLYITGFAPLGIAGLIGKHWDRGSGSHRIVTWNSIAKEAWTVERENPGDQWTPDSSQFLKLKIRTPQSHGDALLLGHFSRGDQFREALAWAGNHQDEMKLGHAVHLEVPDKIDRGNADDIAMECARSFAWARKTLDPFPTKIYWFAGLPLALMPLVTYLARSTGQITFMEFDGAGNYIRAFEL